MTYTIDNNKKVIRARLRKFSIILIAALIFLFVPLIPHMPNCLSSRGPTVLASIFLSDIYVTEVTRRLKIHKINHVSINGVVLIGLWSWLNDDGTVMNSSWKSVMHLVGEHGGEDPVELPDHIEALLASPRTRFAGGDEIDNTCELVRAVAVEGW